MISEIPLDQCIVLPESAEDVLVRALPIDPLSEEDAEEWRVWYIHNTGHSLNHEDREWPTDKKLTLEYVRERADLYVHHFLFKSYD